MIWGYYTVSENLPVVNYSTENRNRALLSLSVQQNISKNTEMHIPKKNETHCVIPMATLMAPASFLKIQISPFPTL